MGRLDRAFAKANQLAQQFNDEMQRARDQQQQQQQQQQRQQRQQQQQQQLYQQGPQQQQQLYQQGPQQQQHYSPHVPPRSDINHSSGYQCFQQPPLYSGASPDTYGGPHMQQQQNYSSQVQQASLAATSDTRQGEWQPSLNIQGTYSHKPPTPNDDYGTDHVHLQKQLEDDRREAERLAAQYEAEYREEERLVAQDMERLKLKETKVQSSEGPPLPPRSSSGTQGDNRLVVPPPTSKQDPSTMIRPSQEHDDGQRAVPPPPPVRPVHASNMTNQSSSRNPAHGNAWQDGLTSSGADSSSHPAGRRLSPPPRHASGIVPVTECVDSPVDLALEWAVHEEASSFVICTRCYVDHIYDSCFSGNFSVKVMGDGVPRRCLFSVDRMKKQLWPAALRSRDLGQAVNFMSLRQTLQNCPSAAFVADRCWYTTSDCPGLTICEACFQDRLAGSSFATRFSLGERLPSAASCDMALPYIVRLFEHCLAKVEWQTFVAEAGTRIRIPQCPKQEVVQGSQYTWFETASFRVCLTCYCDYFVDTESSDKFKMATLKADKMRCALGDLNLLVLIQEATSRKDHSIFWNGMVEISRSPWCDPAGTRGSSWYGLANGAPDFAICGRCMAGIPKPIGVQGFFVERKSTSLQEPFLCAFNTAHPRFAGHMSSFMESILLGQSKPLHDFAAKLSGVPPCPRLNFDAGKNKRWWGWDHANICEECYVTFAKGLSLDSQLVLKGERQSISMMCDLYSPRMREIYQKACKSSDLAGFLDIAKHRRQVYIESYLPAQQMEQQLLIAAEEAQMYGNMGTAYKNMGWTQDAVMGHSYTLGNAQLGYGHVNELALQGAAYDLQSSNARAQVMNSGNWEAIKQHKMRWASVE